MLGRVADPLVSDIDGLLLIRVHLSLTDTVERGPPAPPREKAVQYLTLLQLSSPAGVVNASQPHQTGGKRDGDGGGVNMPRSHSS